MTPLYAAKPLRLSFLPARWNPKRRRDARVHNLNAYHRLFTKYFARETVYRRDQSPQDIAWLGKLALLHLGEAWWEHPDGLHFFSQMIEEHNQLFSFY
jgi:hypothetical protein